MTQKYTIDKSWLTEIIVPGSFIALNSSTHFQQFYVHECCIAKEAEDDNGHCFKGDSYIRCSYLTLLHEKGDIFTTSS